MEIYSPCAMKVIPQLVLIVIPSFIRVVSSDTPTGRSVGSNENGNSLSALEHFEPSRGTSRNRRMLSSSYERDLVMDGIEETGYPAEIHMVTTKDGYILKLHRIPDPALQKDEEYSAAEQSFANQMNGFRGVVLLMHGLFSTAADFIVIGPENGLAFILADAGYDVWLGNARGTRFSRSNIKLSSKTAEFWDFSWHEIGTGDLPAIIDYILRHTKQRKLFYVGHNQGITALLALLSEKPRYNQKIISVAGMAPTAYLGNGNNEILKSLATFNDQLWVAFKSMNIFELTPTEGVLKFLSNIICSGEAVTRKVCTDLLAELFGYTTEHAKLLLPGLLDNLLTGISTKQLIHFGQLVQSKKFQQFDYRNFLTNMQHYKQAKPPEYDMTKITVPFTLFHGTKDFFTTTQDFHRVLEHLSTVKSSTELPDWNHMDFIYNSLVYHKVYSKIIESMKNATVQ